MARGRAVAARRAHNPEVPGSNPGPATTNKTTDGLSVVFIFLWHPHKQNEETFKDKPSNIKNIKEITKLWQA